MEDLLKRRWRKPTLDGPRRVYIDKTVFSVPEDSEIRIVTGSGLRQFGHVKTGGKVHVLSRHGELDEPEPAMRRRANKNVWHGIRGEDL